MLLAVLEDLRAALMRPQVRAGDHQGRVEGPVNAGKQQCLSLKIHDFYLKMSGTYAFICAGIPV